MPVGMCVSRMADSVLLTCWNQSCQPQYSKFTREVGSHLTTSTPRPHHLDLDVLLLKEVVVDWCRPALRWEDLESSPSIS